MSQLGQLFNIKFSLENNLWWINENISHRGTSAYYIIKFTINYITEVVGTSNYDISKCDLIQGYVSEH